MLLAPPEGCVWVAAEDLQRFSPLDRKFWTDGVVTVGRVLAAHAEGRLRSVPVGVDAPLDWDDPEAHAERVAFFVEHGLGDHDFVEIDVGVPEMGCWVKNPVQDGNHRLAGALLRGDRWIPCSIAGSETQIRRLFGSGVADELFQEARAA